MKMKNYSIGLLFLIIFSSCVTRKAELKRYDNLQYESIRAYPQWSYQEKGKWVMPVTGLALGATYGYITETTIGGKKFFDSENAGIWGAGGMLAGLLVNGIIFRNRYSNRDFKANESTEWIKNFNKNARKDYILNKQELNNSLILVPNYKVEEIRRNYKKLKGDVDKINNTVTYKFLQEWKQKLGNDYSILPALEISDITSFISKYEVPFANKDLLLKATEATTVSNTYNSLNPLLAFKNSNYDIYSVADYSTQQKADNLLRDKISSVLTTILSSEKQKLDLMPLTKDGIQKSNAFYREFYEKFEKVSDFQQVSEVYSAIRSKKESIITKIGKSINAEIDNANNFVQLEDIESLYFSHLNLENTSLGGFKNKLRIKREEIKRRLEQQEIERQLAETRAMERYGFNSNTKSLKNGELLKSFFKGNFDGILFNRDDVLFGVLVKQYMYAYANGCRSSLPTNKVEIYESVCKTERVVTNSYGREISRNCEKWEQVGTGLYSSPELYEAYNHIDRLLVGDALSSFWKIITNGMGYTTGMASDAITLKSDMIEFVRIHNCNGKALKRFEENLIRFAYNRPPLKLDGTVATQNVDYNKEQNFQTLTEDLIYENSKSWVTKFIKYSVDNVRIVSKDSQNRPAEIFATYLFEGLFGRQKDEVQITFNNGVPDCLYFRNYSNTCRTADRRIIADFISGKYTVK